MSKSRKRISFMAKKMVSKPTVVRFSTKKGSISFMAKKMVSKPTRVEFYAKRKK